MSKSRIILVGKAASGKDHFRKVLESRGFKYGVSYTTRPPRAGEVNGVDYHFISVDEFQNMIGNFEFYEYVKFNDWYYGTSNKQWYDTDDVFIMTPSGISEIKEEDRKNSLIIFLDIPIEIRRSRLAARMDSDDSAERRIAADEKDFEGFNNFDIRITDDKF